MFGLHSLLKYAVRGKAQVWLWHTSKRNYQQFIGSGICTMPRNRLTAQQKITLTTLMFIWWFPYPVWVLWHMDYYKGVVKDPEEQGE